MIKSSPNKIITEDTDWRFLNEIKRGGIWIVVVTKGQC
jgi:hypothetical protein